MEDVSVIEENKKQKTENKVVTLWDISSHFGLFFWLYLIFIAVTIGWNYLFRFDIPWPTGEEYPSWKVGLFGATYDPLIKGDWGREFFDEIFEEYNNFRHLFQVVTLFYFLPFLMASIMFCFVRIKKWKLLVGIFFGLIILGFQMQFGSLCHDVWQTRFLGHDVGTVWEHILLFGGFGVLLAVVYGLILNYLYKEFAKSEQTSDKFKALFFAHLLAYLALSMILVSYWFSVFGIIAMALFLFFICLILFLIEGLTIIINKITRRKGKTS